MDSFQPGNVAAPAGARPQRPALDAAKMKMWQSMNPQTAMQTTPSMTPPPASMPGYGANGQPTMHHGQMTPTYPTQPPPPMTFPQPNVNASPRAQLGQIADQSGPGHQDLMAMLHRWLSGQMQGSQNNSPYTGYLTNRLGQ